MTTRFLLCLFIISHPISLLSQSNECQCCIEGKILERVSKTPIAFATVLEETSGKYAITDKDGYFKIDICSDNYTLNISCLGYISLTTKSNEHSENTNLVFVLEEETNTLNEVNVKGERVKEKGTKTIAQTTLKKEELKTLPTATLGTAIAQVEGVTFAGTSTNVQIPIIHGLSGNRILVMNNGLKHGFQNWGNEHAPEIDINAANNVTVIKGASGVRFGPEALAGVIMVEPNPLRLNNPFYGNVTAGFETNGLGGNTNFEIGKGNEKWSYFLNGSFTKVGDRFAPGVKLTQEEQDEIGITGGGDTEPRVNLTNTGKEEYAVGLGVRRRYKDFNFKAYYSFIDQNLGLLEASFPDSGNALVLAFNSPVPRIIRPFSYTLKNPREKTTHHLVKGEIDWTYRDDAKFTFRAGAQLNKRQEFAVRRREDQPIIDLDLITYDYQLDWEHPSWKGLDGVLGVQYFTQNNDNNTGTGTLPYIPNYNTFRYGIFAIETLDIGENTLEVGIRFDRETNDVRGENNVTREIFRDRYTFNNLTASLGYQWQVSENSTFKTNLGSAFRTPNVAELFSFGQTGFYSLLGLLRYTIDENDNINANEVIALDNSSVQKETGYKLTNEFKTSNEKNAHAITTYINYIENFVFNRPIDITTGFRGPLVVQIVDQKDALFIGLDYTWTKEFSEKFNATYGLSYLWSRNVGENEPLINQPPINTRVELQWNQGEFLFFSNSTWSLRPNYTFKQFQAPRVIQIETVINGTADINPESEIFDFVEPPEGYFLLDASWNFQYKNIYASISVTNALNTNYRNYLNELRYFADEPGINFLFSVDYKF